MIGDAAREVWRLPSGLRFLDAISDSLTSGGVTIVLLEDWVDRLLFIDDLSWHLSSRGLGLDGVSDSDPIPASAFACVTDGLGLPPATSKFDGPGDAMRRLLGSGQLPGVTAVNVDQRGLGSQQWISFAQEWARVSRSLSDPAGSPPGLCIMVGLGAAPLHDVPTDSHLSVKWMMGVPDTLETRLLCRLDDSDDRAAARKWREHLIPALCGTDFALAAHLWDSVLGDREQLSADLADYASWRGWDAERLREAGVEVHPVDAADDFDDAWIEMSPPQRLRRAWGSGAMFATAEHGAEVHSAALPLLGAGDYLMQRLWRGQIALAMPGIDGVRVAMCSQLNHRFGQRWATEYELPLIEDEARNLKETSLSCQWGHLVYLLKNHGRLRDYAEWIPLAKQARRVRNCLAHGSPIDFEMYAALREEARKQGFERWL